MYPTSSPMFLPSQNIFRRLVKDAGLVVESYRPGTMRRFGLSYATLSRANRRLVMVSISNYGQTGPYRDYRGSTLTLEAIGSATMPWTGQAGKPPLKLAENASLYFAGLTAALGTVAAVMTARATGRGQLVDMSIVEALQASAESKSLQSQYSAEPLGRQANTARFPYLMGTYPCKDGYISLQGSGRGETWWPRIYRMMGMPELEQDPRFSTPEARAANRDEFDAMWYSWLADHTKQEVFAAARKFRFPLAPTNTPEDLVKDPHYNARGFFFEVEHPEMGHVKQPGRPFVMMGTPWRLTRTAPLLGQHNEEVYCGELGYSKGDLVRLRALGVV